MDTEGDEEERMEEGKFLTESCRKDETCSYPL